MVVERWWVDVVVVGYVSHRWVDVVVVGYVSHRRVDVPRENTDLAGGETAALGWMVLIFGWTTTWGDAPGKGGIGPLAQ